MTHDEQTILENLNDAIYGNGRDGLIERTVRIEDATTQLKEASIQSVEDRKQIAVDIKNASKESKDFRVVITKELGEIKSLIVVHNVNKDLHSFEGLVFKKHILTIILLAFVFLHSLIPDSINLWDILKKIIGI